MAVKWQSTGTKGIRYYEHPTRTWKRGVIKYKDRYYAIRYSVDGKQVEEGIGWNSEFAAAKEKALAEAGDDKKKKAMTKAMSSDAEEEAERRIGELKENRRRGEGPRTLKEKRSIHTAKAEKGIRDKLTFSALFTNDYLPSIKKDRKNPRSYKVDEGLFNQWIKSIIGNKPLIDIAPIHLEKIKADMTKAGRSPRYIHYALAVVRQVFNYALRHDLFNGANPISKVKLPGGDNRRLRFLTRDEASALLAEIAKTSPDVHDMALTSLHTGMRAGEVFGLTWADVDIDKGLLILRNTKSGRTRAAFMTEAVKEVFRCRERGTPSDLVFPDRTGKRIEQISNTFARAVDTLKLNEGVEDRRHRVTFHTLRHTYASWHVENGTDLYAVKELLGHADFKMTARYSHLGENTLQAAVKRLDSTLQDAVKVVVLTKKG